MKITETKRQKLLANGDALYHGGRFFVAIEAVADGASLATDEDEKAPSVPEPKAKADGNK